MSSREILSPHTHTHTHTHAHTHTCSLTHLTGRRIDRMHVPHRW